MTPFRNALLLFLLVFSSNLAFSQRKPISTQETTELVQESTRLMLDEKYEESLIKSRRALENAIILNNNNLIANCYNTIAANFDQLTEFEKAFFYYKKGLIYAEKTNNNKLKNWINNNIANIYCFDKKQYDTGIYYYKKSLE